MADFTQGLCAILQENINNAVEQLNPATKTGYLDALVSPLNTSGMKRIPLPNDDGKVRSIKLVGVARICDEDIVDVCPDICGDGPEPEPFEDTITLTHCISNNPLIFNDKNLRLICDWGNNQGYFQAQIIGVLDRLTRRLNRNLLGLQNANFGNFNPALIPNQHTVNLLMGTMQAPMYFGLSEIQKDFSNIGFDGTPIIVGDGNIYHFTKMLQIGCCNENGLDLSKAGGSYNFFRDPAVDALIGSNHFIGLVPGMVQLLTGNDNKGDFAKNWTGILERNTIIDPRTGIEWDFNLIYEPCTGIYKLTFGLHYEPYWLTDKAYNYCDELHGTNGTLHFIGNSLDCDPCFENPQT
jgi:hypothetical protein